MLRGRRSQSQNHKVSCGVESVQQPTAKAVSLVCTLQGSLSGPVGSSLSLWIFQLLYLFLFKTPRPDFYLVQNPPSIPTLIVVWLVARIQRARFIIDWHNFGFTIMSLSL